MVYKNTSKATKELNRRYYLEHPLVLGWGKRTEGVSITRRKPIIDDKTREYIDAKGVIGENVDTKNLVVYLKLNNKTTEILDNAFLSSGSLEFVETSPSLKKIGKSAFSQCENLKYVTLAEGVQEIGDKAFFRCGNIREGVFIIPESVKKIGKNVFDFSSVCRLICSRELAEKYVRERKDELQTLEIFAVDGEYLFRYKSAPMKTTFLSVYEWNPEEDNLEDINIRTDWKVCAGNNHKPNVCNYILRNGEWKESNTHKGKNGNGENLNVTPKKQAEDELVK